MEINKELKHIAEYQNSILPRHQKRTEEAVEIIANDAIESLKNGTFDFKSFLHLDLNQNGKHRQVIMYKPFSPEELLCIFLKRVLDRKFHISYPNRNEYIRTLFDTAAAIKDMSDYTIFKFDFSDFFNSVSSEYVYHKYIQSASLERYQDKLMANFVNATKYTFAGLNTSNIRSFNWWLFILRSEIIASHYAISCKSSKQLLNGRKCFNQIILVQLPDIPSKIIKY